MDLPTFATGLLLGGGAAFAFHLLLTGQSRQQSVSGNREREFNGHSAPSEPSAASLGTDAPELATSLESVFDTLDLQICLLDKTGVIIQSNLSWRRFVDGIDQPDLGAVGANYTRFCQKSGVFTDDAARELSNAVSLVADQDLTEFSGNFDCEVGQTTQTLEVRLLPLNDNGGGAVVVLQNNHTNQPQSEELVKERRKAETLASALEASQASLELAMRGGELGLWHWDVGAGYFELSGDWLARLDKDGADNGLNADVESFRELIHPDELVFWTEDDAASLAPLEPYDRQFRLRFPDGQYRWVQVLGRTTSVDPNGVPESLSGVLIDINDRKSIELRDAGMAKIIEESHNEVYIADCVTHRFLEVNRGARENLGYTIEELREMGPADLHAGMTEEDLITKWDPLVNGEAERLEFESTVKRSDGTSYPLMLTLQKARLIEQDVIVAIGVDLTQRRQLESQLAQAQRLESIGQLAAGIAHEMNTPLQFIGNNMRFLGNCSDAMLEVFDSLETNLNPDGPERPWQERYSRMRETMERTHFDRIRKETPSAIADSLEGVERVLQIVRAMKEFSHPGDQLMAETDLNHSLQSTTTVTRSHWKNHAELRLDLDPGLPCVECESGAINQVFVNLIVNAADAISARLQDDPSGPTGRLTVRSFADGEHAVFEVEDNGCGMSEKIKRHAFDQFFTTKEVGQGTGQGLSLSHTIVTKKHNGQLEIDSAPAQGTVMRVRLPFKAARPATEPVGPPVDRHALETS